MEQLLDIKEEPLISASAEDYTNQIQKKYIPMHISNECVFDCVSEVEMLSSESLNFPLLATIISAQRVLHLYLK